MFDKRCACYAVRLFISTEGHSESVVAYKDLREFVKRLEKSGELKRISAEVDPVLEITEITHRVTRAGGPALLFERPKGSRIPLLINALGSERRIQLALEVDSFEEVAERIRGFLDMQAPQGLLDKIKMLPKLAELGSFFPKTVKTGPCKEVVRRDGFSLLEFPILQCWPQDAGRFITWPLVITRNPETGKRNVGVYRMQVFDEQDHGNALADAKARRGTFSAGARGESARAASTSPWPSARTRSPAWPESCRFRRTSTR